MLSSSWRTTSTLQAQVNSVLERNGLPYCIGATCTSNASGVEANRAREIMLWVESHAAACADGYVVLDDMDLSQHLPEAGARFVRTDAASGLTEADALLAVRLLGGPEENMPTLLPPTKPGAFNILVTRSELERDAIRAAMAGS